ncbi:hypothetical protein CFC21_038526 [Triticum aestivum]|uniref:KIB1-4 beta-propeller domain-containing protein n=2 Tax=Triticum aestivum TaxID=4565 RepID=A0A3B6ETH1_WHEAT|nr:hypothetical protein CFC21_038526 [Triticum aestivum]
MAGAEGLPRDLLEAIYRRCSSPYDRARFAAVCTSWQAAALEWRTPLPALPLLLPSTGIDRRDRMARAYSLEDGRVLRAPLPYFPYGKRIVGCHDGGWVAATSGSLVEVVNLFTGARLMQRDLTCKCPTVLGMTDKISLDKVVFSEEPVTKGCIMAAITKRCKIVLCGLDGKDDSGWSTQGCGTHEIPNLVDITFYNGELYGLSCDQYLYRFAIGRNKDGASAITLFKQLTAERPIYCGNAKYIFELRGKLAIAVEILSICSAPTFRVFELAVYWDIITRSYYTWVEVTCLGDHALFLGPGCCKATHVSSTGVADGVVEANRIYYTRPEGYANHLPMLDLGSCAVYCSVSDDVQRPNRIMSQGYYYREKDYGCNYSEKEDTSWHNTCTWVLPPHF